MMGPEMTLETSVIYNQQPRPTSPKSFYYSSIVTYVVIAKN
jgi:hypothetical protein